MTVYHISIHGEAVPCDAKIQCRAKGGPGSEHFEGTREDARAWAEKHLEKIHYTSRTLSKPKSMKSTPVNKNGLQHEVNEPERIRMKDFDYALVTADTAFEMEMGDDPLLNEGDSVKKMKGNLEKARVSGQYSNEKLKKLEAQTWAYELYFAKKKIERHRELNPISEPKDRFWHSGVQKFVNSNHRQERQHQSVHLVHDINAITKRKPEHAENEYDELLENIAKSYKH